MKELRSSAVRCLLFLEVSVLPVMWSPFWDVSQSKSNHIWIPKVNPIANPTVGFTLGICWNLL